MANNLYINLNSDALKTINNDIISANDTSVNIYAQIKDCLESVTKNIQTPELNQTLRLCLNVIDETGTKINSNINQLTTFLEEQAKTYETLHEDIITKINSAIAAMNALADEVASSK